MTQAEAAVVAACIAAIASIIGLGVNLRSGRNSSMRTAYRSAIEPYLADLGTSTHGVVASALIVRKRINKGSDTKSWLDKAQKHKEQLDGIRPKIKYTLYGIDGPLKTLSRMPSWLATYGRVERTNVELITRQLILLANMMDDTIRISYAQGKPPSKRRIRKLNNLNGMILDLWGNRWENAPDKNSEQSAFEELDQIDG